MANAVYDPETENQGAPGGKAGLRDAEQDGGLYNPEGDTGAVSPDGLKDSEEEPQESRSLYNPRDRGTFRQRARARYRGLFKNKWLVGFGLGGSAFIGLLFLLLMMLGSFKLAQLAEHIAVYQFARAARNYSLQVNQITAEEVAISTADRSALKRAHDRFGLVKDKTWGSMWNKIDNYRPDKITQNMITDGTLDFKYERGGATSLWKKKLTAIVVEGKEIPVNNRGLFYRYVHPLQARQDRLAFSDEVNRSLAKSMQGRSSIIRGAVAKSIRDRLGVQLKWWKQLSKYRGVDNKRAAVLTQIEAEAEINKSIKPARSSVSQVSDAEEKANSALKECVAETACVEETVENKGKLSRRVIDAINGTATAGIFKEALNFINPLFAVGLPVCLIYDGSLQGGQGQNETINNANTQAQRSFYMVASAADQQKYGHTTGEAVGGMNWKVGDISKSIPEKRASGIPVNTSTEFNPQASAIGDLGNTVSIFSFLPSPASDLANAVAPKACELVTNIWTGSLIGIGSLVAGFFSGGTTEIAKQGLMRAMIKYMADFGGKLFTKKELIKMGLYVGGTEGLIMLAQVLVAQKAAVNNAGLATGPSFVNVADAGGNLNAQETSKGFYGRPLKNSEVAASTYKNDVFAAAMKSDQSVFERYFAVTNPDSLVTRMGTGLSARINMSLFSSLLDIGARILSPLKSLAGLFGSLSPQIAMAANSADTQNYGNVQSGWSNDEENLIENNPDYLPLENQKILAESGMSDAIEQKYGPCFDLDKSMGDMLTGDDPMITRADNGDVTNEGLCSPAKLTYTNNEFGPAMVFRWRVEKSYETTLDQLINMQEITASSDTSSSGAPVSGDAQELARDILNNDNISKLGRYVTEDLQNTADGKPAYGNVTIALGILQFLADLGNTTSYTITSITGAGSGHHPGSNHYSGHAVDFGCPFDEAKADEVAKKYGLMAQNERCENTPADNKHSHFSEDGY